jgi:hypothetical protein
LRHAREPKIAPSHHPPRWLLDNFLSRDVSAGPLLATEIVPLLSEPRIGQEVATPTQRTQLDTEAELIGRPATALDFVQVSPRQAEVLAQDRRLDLSRQSLGGVDLV